MWSNTISEAIETVCELFSDNNPYCVNKGKRRFPSFITPMFRFMLEHLSIVFPVLLLVIFLYCSTEDIPFIGGIIVSLIATVLVLFLLFLVLVIVSALESLAKQLASLIRYGKLAESPANPIDFAVISMMKGRMQ